MADNITQEMVDSWPPAQRKAELKRLGLSTGGNRNAQLNRLFKELERQHARNQMESGLVPMKSLLTADSIPSSASSSAASVSIPPVKTCTSATQGKRYCAVCRKYDGQQQEDGSTLSLHRVPDGQSKEKQELRTQWVRALKLFRADFPSNPSSSYRVCDDHFPGGYKPGAVPTSFSKQQQQSTPRRTIVKKPLPSPSPILLPLPSPDDVIPTTRDIGVQVGPPMSSTFKEAACQAKLPVISPEDLKQQGDDKTKFYTGFVSFAMFNFMFQLFLKHGADKLNYWDGEHSTRERDFQNNNQRKRGPKRQLRPIDEFLMLCMKLRLNLLHESLADMFYVSVSTVSRILNTWVNFCYDHSLSLVTWPSKERIMQCLPPHFKDYPNCSIILDCTEIFIEKPSSLSAQWQTWSEYKHHNTVKILIGVTPNGMVNFVSRLWGGRASDRHITQYDNFLPLLQPDTTVMADKGFTIEDLLPPNVGLNDNNNDNDKQLFSDMSVHIT